MKKILIALGVVAIATVSQAATFKWTTSAVPYGIDAAAVTDNDDYAAGTTQMKGKGTWSVILSLYDATTGDLVGSSDSTTVKFGATNAKVSTTITVDAAEQGTTYSYVLAITGTQTDLTARGEEAVYN